MLAFLDNIALFLGAVLFPPRPPTDQEIWNFIDEEPP